MTRFVGSMTVQAVRTQSHSDLKLVMAVQVSDEEQ